MSDFTFRFMFLNLFSCFRLPQFLKNKNEHIRSTGNLQFWCDVFFLHLFSIPILPYLPIRGWKQEKQISTILMCTSAREKNTVLFVCFETFTKLFEYCFICKSVLHLFFLFHLLFIMYLIIIKSDFFTFSITLVGKENIDFASS